MLQSNKAFAIESYISKAYSMRGYMGIGYFLIHLHEKTFGKRADDATGLACSYDSVLDRINRKGKHLVPEYFVTAPAIEIATLIRLWYSTAYKELQMSDGTIISSNAFSEMIYKNNLLWATKPYPQGL
ncbi:hypothetical protein FACS189485_12080 [Spirochaetia bacterium]|nr:hypothetical protein FACS189485_12080 [Spirochaetia bacterium]